jgi:Protein of unknown function (DUF1573)
MSRLLLGVAGLLAFGNCALAGPTEMFEERDKDFGVSPKGTVLVHYFRFTNNTNDTVTLGQPRVSCGCVTPALLTNKLAPGETGVVIAYMDTRRIQHAGVTKTVTIFVPFHTPRFEEVSLKVTTVTRDDLLMSPDTLALGAVTKGKTAKATTKVTFTSDADWTIKKVTSTGAYVKPEFKLASRNGNVVTYDVTAVLDKDCPAGNWLSDIYLETSNPAVEKLRIPVTVNVVASLAASPAALSFDNIALGSRDEQTITIQSKTPFKILEVKGTDDIVKVKVDTDVARASHTLTFAVKPSGKGDVSRKVVIVTDNKDQPSVIVPVSAKVTEK